MKKRKKLLGMVIMSILLIVVLILNISNFKIKDSVVKTKNKEIMSSGAMVKEISIDAKKTLYQNKDGDVFINKEKIFRLENSKLYNPSISDVFKYVTKEGRVYYVVIVKFSNSEYDFRLFDSKYNNLDEQFINEMLDFYSKNISINKNNIKGFLSELEKKGKL